MLKQGSLLSTIYPQNSKMTFLMSEFRGINIKTRISQVGKVFRTHCMCAFTICKVFLLRKTKNLPIKLMTLLPRRLLPGDTDRPGNIDPLRDPGTEGNVEPLLPLPPLAPPPGTVNPGNTDPLRPMFLRALECRCYPVVAFIAPFTCKSQ